MELYGLKTCDSCRKALKALPQAVFVDVRKDGVPEDVLRAAFDTFGETLLNRQSATWRGLDESARSQDPVSLIKEIPSVMKRPLIVQGGVMSLGWKADAQAVWDLP